MTTPLSSFSGIISGFNYRDLVDAIIAQARVPATRWENEQAANTARVNALGTYRSLLTQVQTASKALRTGTAFDAMSTTTSITSGTRAIASASADSTAVAGSYRVAVTQLARAEKLAGSAGTDAVTALGASGDFTVNGQSVTVTATDTLNTLRDKINALNTGTSPTNVSATVLTVGPGDARLILTSTTSGASGITLADTTGTTLQDLGYIDGFGANQVAATLVSGADAVFTIDDIAITRTSNVVTDAIAGVTLTLTGDDVGAVTTFNVERHVDTARSSMQQFVDSYNELVAFLKVQGTASGTGATPALYGQSLIRTARSQLPSLLLEAVGGAAADLATVSAAGLSLTRDGTLTLDATLFDTAFTTRQSDLRTLFTESRTASGTGLEFVSSAASAAAGTYAVDISALATQATLTTSGFSGSYDDGGTADQLTVTNSGSGSSISIALTTGMTTGDIVTALQSALDAAGIAITASAVGNELQLMQQAYGLTEGIAIDVTGTGDGASELWNAPASAAGTDMVGTIGGEAATGVGQVLVGDSGTAGAGLTIRYDGVSTGAVGSITLGLGAGARVERLLNQFLDSGGGLVDKKLAEISSKEARLESQINALDNRLERRRAVLLQSFFAMEAAVARLQQQSTSLQSFITTSNSSTS